MLPRENLVVKLRTYSLLTEESALREYRDLEQIAEKFQRRLGLAEDRVSDLLLFTRFPFPNFPTLHRQPSKSPSVGNALRDTLGRTVAETVAVL